MDDKLETSSKCNTAAKNHDICEESQCGKGTALQNSKLWRSGTMQAVYSFTTATAHELTGSGTERSGK